MDRTAGIILSLLALAMAWQPNRSFHADPARIRHLTRAPLFRDIITTTTTTTTTTRLHYFAPETANLLQRRGRGAVGDGASRGGATVGSAAGGDGQKCALLSTPVGGARRGGAPVLHMAMMTTTTTASTTAWTVWGWIFAISGFMIKNYGANKTTGCWPSILQDIPLRAFHWIHSVSAMLFAGSIITTTILEWQVVESARDSAAAAVAPFWFQQASSIERTVVLPALAGLIVSGVGQCFLRYGGGVKYAPRHIKSSLHFLTLFGMWWGWTDRATQGLSQVAAQNLAKTGGPIPPVFYQRRISNVVSCLFLLVLYGFMVLKPGYAGS